MIISAVIGPILVYWATEIIKSYTKNASRINHIKAYEENLELTNLLEEISTFPGVRKSVLIKNTNGGGIPKLGNHIKSSIIFPFRWNKVWNNQLVDSQFSDLTLEVLQKGKHSFYTDNLEIDTYLYTLLKSQDVIFSYWEELLVSPKSYSFLSIEFYLKEEDIIDEVKNSIRVKINEIKNLYHLSDTLNNY